ncbi:MAG TPA: class II fructose-bisphosphate aldolase [Anaerolineales bacterium]|nr:class II fructose-bisphosphate aldolase [Anaerolineales bacterium]
MSDLGDVGKLTGNSVVMHASRAEVKDAAKFRSSIPELVKLSALGPEREQGRARFLIRLAALELGILPSSIHDLYMARGRGEVLPSFTVPAMNLRVLSYEAARAAFRVARRLDAGAFIFEIARSEMGYTGQNAAEYSTNILAAAISEEWSGPVFVQGDHFQLSPKKYQADPDGELNAVKDLAREAVAAGFYNIDVDASTLVDISRASTREQQEANVRVSSELATFIRGLEPEGIFISIGGEIGEVGGHNSTAEELRTFMDGFNLAMPSMADGKPGLSKISIQTGTSHGGTVLPNGTLAQVNIDFRTLKELSQLSRAAYGLGGAVQHGASTLPEDAFHKFVEYEAVEVHLATSFMTQFYETAPKELCREIYAWLDSNYAGERKPGMTNEQFYYKARKYALGPFKRQIYELEESARDRIGAVWEKQFGRLFDLLGAADTRKYVEAFVRPVAVLPTSDDYLGRGSVPGMADDLQD